MCFSSLNAIACTLRGFKIFLITIIFIFYFLFPLLVWLFMGSSPPVFLRGLLLSALFLSVFAVSLRIFWGTVAILSYIFQLIISKLIFPQSYIFFWFKNINFNFLIIFKLLQIFWQKYNICNN
jgi:hypothetical protein